MIEERQMSFNEVDLSLSFHEKCMDRGFVLNDSIPQDNMSQNN